ncbi:Ubiquitin carboxyl-terminal hydrolase isozyme L5, partial [Ophiophagus hannah]
SPAAEAVGKAVACVALPCFRPSVEVGEGRAISAVGRHARQARENPVEPFRGVRAIESEARQCGGFLGAMAGGGSAGEWCLMESDPGVFTELIKGFGCRGAQVEEIWSLEPENFEKLKPVHGLIFLFKWQPGEEPAGSVVQDSRLDTLFFAKQV